MIRSRQRDSGVISLAASPCCRLSDSTGCNGSWAASSTQSLCLWIQTTVSYVVWESTEEGPEHSACHSQRLCGSLTADELDCVKRYFLWIVQVNKLCLRTSLFITSNKITFWTEVVLNIAFLMLSTFISNTWFIFSNCICHCIYYKDLISFWTVHPKNYVCTKYNNILIK